jgi:hypothetical protein
MMDLLYFVIMRIYAGLFRTVFFCIAVLPAWNAHAGGSDSRSQNGSPVFVASGHPVYSFIDMLPLPEIVEGVNLSVRPLTEKQIVTVLRSAETTVKNPDSAIVRYYLHEFIGNSADRTVRDHAPKLRVIHGHDYATLYPTIRSTWAVQDSAYDERGFQAFRMDSLSDTRGLSTANDAGVVVTADIHGLVLHFDGVITTEYSTVEQWYKTNHPQHGEIYTTILSERGEAAHFIGGDAFRTYIYFPNKILNVKIGNDHIAWGRSGDLNFILTPLNSPFFNVSVQKDLRMLDFNYVFGRLVADKSDDRRNVYAKRFTLQPKSWLTLGFSDQAITINRDIEGLYFFPFLPFFFAEHYLGDPDNRLMSFDAFANILSYGALYGELFMDDLKNLASFITNDDSGDKWAFLIGCRIFSPIPKIPSQITFEFTRTEPWVYTTSAKDNYGEYNYPIHAGQLLGNQYGPHSRVLRARMAAHFSPKIFGTLLVEHSWKGDGPGSSAYDINPYIMDTTSTGLIWERQQYQTKEYRFSNFVRNRTVVSLRADFRPAYWCRLYALVNAIREREPRTDNSFSCGLGVTVNRN